MREEELRKEYERKLASLRREQSLCNHEWGEVVYDPEIKKRTLWLRIETQGSDVWFRPTGCRDVECKRWSRTCKLCEKTEYTNELVPIKYEPKFK